MNNTVLRGFLRILVLKALGEGPKSGYCLMKFVEERIGSKPSSGSIYPLLEMLKREHLVDAKGVGRSTEYIITNEGRKKLQLIEEKRNECLCNFLNGMKMLSALTGEDMSFPKTIIESMQKGEVPFKEIPEWHKLRKILFTMFQNGELKSNVSRVRRILANACKEFNKS